MNFQRSLSWYVLTMLGRGADPQFEVLVLRRVMYLTRTEMMNVQVES